MISLTLLKNKSLFGTFYKDFKSGSSVVVLFVCCLFVCLFVCFLFFCLMLQGFKNKGDTFIHLFSTPPSVAPTITAIRLLDESGRLNPSHGRVELQLDILAPLWYGICKDGSNDPRHHSWDRMSAIVACRQLNFLGGWNESVRGLSTRYTLEDFSCRSGRPSYRIMKHDDDLTMYDDCWLI